MNVAKIVKSGPAARVILEAAILSVSAGIGLFAAVVVNPLLPL